jgi:hypothetical protein
MNPSLRFKLHEPAASAFKGEPPPPVVASKATLKEHKQALKEHYESALCAALNKLPNRYERSMFAGIIRRLRGHPSSIAKPLFIKQSVMPALREWAEKRGLI